MLDLAGPAFLSLYLKVLVCGMIATVVLRRVARGRGVTMSAREVRGLSPYSVAYLSGRRGLVVQSVLSSLVQDKAIRIDSTSRVTLVDAGFITPKGAHRLESIAIEAVRTGTRTLLDLRRTLAPWAAELRSELVAEGLLRSRRYSYLAAAPLYGVVGLGGAKVIVGLSRGRPVFFLAVLLLLTVVSVWVFVSKEIITQRGRSAIARLRASSRALELTVKTASQSLVGHDVAMAVALFGVATIPNEGAFSSLRGSITSDGGSTSSCASSSCSSGSSCGGCGGGGCGGCS
ncbi:MAG: TIGR04222 domain-containing membrane protein [Deltaproteobacteria bacterium]|nr:TIGR04222 domain-containing membrane protein [Deltaproteobacteria bacterium]